MKKIRLLLADDHAVLRAGLKMLLHAEPDLEVVGEAQNGEEAFQQVERLRPEVVLMDLGMPRQDGILATRRITERFPATRVLALTMYEDEDLLIRFLQAGGAGYVLKKAADTELIVAIRAVQRGETFLYPEMARSVVKVYLQYAPKSAPPKTDGLSPREIEVLRLIAQGYTNQEVADTLFLSIKTVATYRSRLHEKLGLRTRAELVRYATEKGLLEDALSQPPKPFKPAS